MVMCGNNKMMLLAALIRQVCELHKSCYDCPFRLEDGDKLCMMYKLDCVCPEDWLIIDINGANYDLPEEYRSAGR